MGLQLKRTFCSKTFATGPSKPGNVVCQMENQTESRKNQGNHILQVQPRQKNGTQSKTVCLSSSAISRNNFWLSTHFQTLWGHPRLLQHQVPLIKATGQQKWGPSPFTLIQIYKQCVRPSFEYGSLSTITTSPQKISSAKFNGSKTSSFGLSFVYQNTSVLSCSMTPLAFHMWRIDSSRVQPSP